MKSKTNQVKQQRLNPKQELFCKYYATDKEMFGNGTLAYSKAYGVDITQPGKKNIAKANASRLLTYDYILNRINKLLELEGLSDERVDKELLFLISQNADFHVKLGAIKEYNSLRKRIVKKEEVKVTKEVNLTSYMKEIEGMSIHELQKIA